MLKEGLVVKLKVKALAGIVRPYNLIDRMMRSQGFSRLRQQSPPVYGLKIRDMASGQVYRLTVTTTSAHPDRDPQFLRLEFPQLEPQNQKHPIPESVISAACEKMEEVASYLRS
jgi:hypothetical protein